MKTILVTGSSGFLGNSVLKKLKSLENKKYDVLSPSSKKLNLMEYESVNNFFEYNKIDYVIHLAADVGGIGYSRTHPGSQLFNNTIMNSNIIHYSYLHKVKKVIGIGSVCEYPKFTKIPFNESDLWLGYPEETNAAYGISKRHLLELSKSYHQQYGFISVHLLLINLYGPMDNFDKNDSHVIPAIIRKIYEAKVSNDNSIHVWGDGSASREFIYVDDAAEAIFLALEGYNKPIPINIGTGSEITILELTKIIMKLMNYKGEIIFDKTKPNGQPRRKLNISKAKKELNFEAKTSLEEGLKKTIDYYYKLVSKKLL